MDVSILICWHPGNIFHASVASVECDRGWHKLYRSKEACVEELGNVGLLTILDQDEVMKSDFHTRDKVFIFRAAVEAGTLTEACFVETTPAKPN